MNRLDDKIVFVSAAALGIDATTARMMDRADAEVGFMTGSSVMVNGDLTAQ